MVTPNNAGTSEKANTFEFPKFKMPNVDMNAVIDSYKKNLEVLGLISKMSIEVCNGITKLQSAFVKQMMADMGSVWEKTGKPADSGLISVTIVSSDGCLADALSTSLFVMGKEKALAYWETHSDSFDVILVEEDGGITVTRGLDGIFSSELKYEIYPEG